MDFFSAQDQARRNTGRLVILFLLAVVCLVVLTNLMVMLVFNLFNFASLKAGFISAFSWRIFSIIGGIVLLVIFGGTTYKIAALSGGGDAVAAMLGAKPIFGDDEDFYVQRAVNVVEEMAIAAGTAVPQVYLLEEHGINAMAAGLSTSDAVIVLTRGAIRELNREQLQGVVAHEFSHLVNGDTRINIRLVGVLHGILLLGLIGQGLLRDSGRTARRSSGYGVALGLGLICIGYAGTFFGNLIKAAVSRQREFLADAAAVQFTRNPEGIGGALLRIMGSKYGSLLKTPAGSQFSHALFCQGVSFTWEGLFATHPNLEDRIHRILPQWDGNIPTVVCDEGQVGMAAAKEESLIGAAAFTGPAAAAASISPGEAQLHQAKLLLRAIPDPLQKAARDPFAARALVAMLVLDDAEPVRQKQLEYIRTGAERGVATELSRLLKGDCAIGRELKLPLLELALPTLRRLSGRQVQTFLINLEELIQADERVSLFEWCLRTIVRSYLEDAASPSLLRQDGSRISLAQAAAEVELLLSTMAHSSRTATSGAEESFAAALAKLPGLHLTLIPGDRLAYSQFDRALQVLKRLMPLDKEKLYAACQACAMADSHLKPLEAELLRAVTAVFGVPVPPLNLGSDG